MFFDFPYQRAGFSDKEWSLIPSGVKRIIRDYYLNGKDKAATEKYCFYETDFRIRRVEKHYGLDRRPRIAIRAAEFSFA